jgi:hypothetical protein
MTSLALTSIAERSRSPIWHASFGVIALRELQGPHVKSGFAGWFPFWPIWNFSMHGSVVLLHDSPYAGAKDGQDELHERHFRRSPKSGGCPSS